MYNVPKFLRRDGNALLFDGDGEFIFYVPEVNFGGKSAIVDGSHVRLLGVLNYEILNKSGGSSGLKTFSWPTIFLCKPYAIEKRKGLKLVKTNDAKDYRILRFKNGDEVVTNVHTPQIIDNVEEMFRLFLITGNIPTTISYLDLYEYFDRNMNLNGSDYGLNDQLWGAVISETCRDPEDISRPYRLSKAFARGDMNSYIPVSIKTIPKYISPYVAITSENIDESIISSVLLSDNPKGHKYSPLERVLTM